MSLHRVTRSIKNLYEEQTQQNVQWASCVYFSTLISRQPISPILPQRCCLMDCAVPDCFLTEYPIESKETYWGRGRSFPTFPTVACALLFYLDSLERSNWMFWMVSVQLRTTKNGINRQFQMVTSITADTRMVLSVKKKNTCVVNIESGVRNIRIYLRSLGLRRVFLLLNSLP